MANKVAPHKLAKVKQGLLENKSIRQAMLASGYSESKANRGMDNKVVQEAMKQNKADLDAQGLGTEELIRKKREHLLECIREFKKARSKDYKLKWGKQLNEVGDSILKYTVGEKVEVKDTTPQDTQNLINRIFEDN